jgi:copper(I)-binding protein
MRHRAEAVRGSRAEFGVFGLSRPRVLEIGIAVVLTLAALIFVALTVWAADRLGLRVADTWARPTAGESRTTAAYMTIANDGEADDVLRAVRSPKVKAIEVHQTTMTPDGVMQMRKVEDGLPIPAGAALELAPGGAHLMLIGLEEPLKAGDQVTLTLEFEKAAPIEVAVPVKAEAPDMPEHMQMDMQH